MGDDPAATNGEETDAEAGFHGNEGHGEPSRDGVEATADTTGSDHGTDTTTVDDPTDGAGDADGVDDPTDGAGDADGVDDPTGGAGDADGVDDPTGGAGDADGVDDPTGGAGDADGVDAPSDADRPPEDVRKYERFKKVDGAQYDRVNDFLRERTYITAREWAIARLCADFRTETGVEMTKIGDNLPYLVPFMTDTYSPQAVNQARHAFREKVRKSGATFLYGAMCGFFTAEELDELMYEVSEIAKFLLEVEGVDLAVAEELDAEERISSVMREVREASSELRAEDLAEASDD
ncbi:DUF5806 family protein [Salinigranum marinum]|uniref:DUF5806 family protein n=1 Tax=Salinigranum marinum TaxID=1515595 RepID=UPI002989EA47|nr:DUF5806 family protein [Salinigranum marinum]